MAIFWIIVCLLHTFTSSVLAEKPTFVNSPASVNFTQGQTAEIVWNIFSNEGGNWTVVAIFRKIEKTLGGLRKIIVRKDSIQAGLDKSLTGRENDINLEIKGQKYISINLTLRNLVKADELYYNVVVEFDQSPQVNFITYLRVHGIYSPNTTVNVPTNSSKMSTPGQPFSTPTPTQPFSTSAQPFKLNTGAIVGIALGAVLLLVIVIVLVVCCCFCKKGNGVV